MLRFWAKYKEDVLNLKKQKKEELEHIINDEDNTEYLDSETQTSQSQIFDKEEDTRLVDNDLYVLSTPNAWLTDSILNRFIEMIYKSNIISCGIYTQRDIDSNYIKPLTMKNANIVFIYSTFFYKILFDSDPENYKDALKHNTKKLRNVDITCCERIIIPVNIENLHWAVIVIHGEKITYFDSFIETENMNFQPMIKKMIQVARFINFVREKQGKHPIEYFYEVYPHKFPQHDSFSCGVYVCYRIKAVIDGDIYDELEHKDVATFRQRIANYLCRSDYVFN